MERIYDLIGVGIGPFNLGLAALCSEIGQLDCLFFDKRRQFVWHEGMMLENAKLQVPFHADLVTLANPCSRYSYLSYLKAKRRLFRFTIREDYFPLRKEFNDYCHWVSAQLPSLKFDSSVRRVYFDNDTGLYKILVASGEGLLTEYLAKHIVIGIGAAPFMPAGITGNASSVFHSADYLNRRKELLDLKDITIVGSGQSAAEIFNDLLTRLGDKEVRLNWFTRSGRIFPMDYSKFALEMTSPDYIDYFFGLPGASKAVVLKDQSQLYKGINSSLIEEIYNKLYIASIDPEASMQKEMRANCSLEAIQAGTGGVTCSFRQKRTSESFDHTTDALILATGYKYYVPEFIEPVRARLNWDTEGRYQVNRNYSIDNENRVFVQNAELHSHGFNAPDLGMGPYRNAVILNTILQSDYFDIEDTIAFQHFI